jgi:hypothetical protein
MSTEADHAREIAERIARRVASDTPTRSQSGLPKAAVNSELAAVRAGLSDLQRKIAQLEAKVSSGSDVSETARPSLPMTQLTHDSPRQVPSTHSPWLAGINASYSHPSEEKFGVEEAVITELVDYFEKEKTCSMEPGGKPCDHCAMCSSRGF